MTTLLSDRSVRGSGDRAAHGRAPLTDEVDLGRDRVLIARAQEGDRGAFDELYLHYYRRLYRLCLRRLYDAHEAEDVAQEAFVRAWRALPRFCGDKRFYPWLSVIAANLCTDVLRKRNRATPVAEFFGADTSTSGESPDEGMVASVDAELVRRAFAQLSERHRRILTLREHSGMSYQAIAEEEGVAISAVETLLWRARQALKREFAAVAGVESRPAVLVGLGGLGALLRRLAQGARRAGSRLAHLSPAGAVATVGSAAAGTAVVVAAATGHLGSSPPAHLQHPGTTSADVPATVHPGSGTAGTTGSGSNAPGTAGTTGGSHSGGSGGTRPPGSVPGAAGSSSGSGSRSGGSGSTAGLRLGGAASIPAASPAVGAAGNGLSPATGSLGGVISTIAVGGNGNAGGAGAALGGAVANVTNGVVGAVGGVTKGVASTGGSATIGVPTKGAAGAAGTTTSGAPVGANTVPTIPSAPSNGAAPAAIPTMVSPIVGSAGTTPGAH